MTVLRIGVAANRYRLLRSNGTRVEARPVLCESTRRVLVLRQGVAMEVTRKGWFGRREVVGDFPKFGVPVQRVRIPSDQSQDRQVGSEPCDGVGNHDGDT